MRGPAGCINAATAILAALLWAGPVAADELIFNYTSYNRAEHGVFPSHEHRTGTRAPKLLVATWDREAMCPTTTGGSHFFMRHQDDGGHYLQGQLKASPLIVSAEDLSAVYVNRSFSAVFDVRVQQDRGKRYLTFFGGPISAIGLGDGWSYVYDESYREVYKVAAKGLSVKADLHEFELTGDGTALLTAYDSIPNRWGEYGDIRTGTGMPDRRASYHQRPKELPLIRDSVLQEIDLETGELLFQWRASDHIPLEWTYEHAMWGYWDFFHLNSIQKTPDGNYLICARHAWSLHLINGTTGEVIWTLGGKGNMFAELSPVEGLENADPVLSMSWMHHARLYPGRPNEITLFDNHVLNYNGPGCKRHCSRGIHIRIDTAVNPPTVQLLAEYKHPIGLQSQSQGSVQVLENGNVLVGWGRNPAVTEHLPTGEVVFDLQFSPWRSSFTEGNGLDNYRAYRFDWVGKPYWDPKLVVDGYHESNESSITVSLSWNGATEVKSWALLSSAMPDDLDGYAKVIATAPRDGFETYVILDVADTPFQYIRAVALDKTNHILGSTGVFNFVNNTYWVDAPAVTSITGPGRFVQILTITDVFIDELDDSMVVLLLPVVLVGCLLAYVRTRRWLLGGWRSGSTIVRDWWERKEMREWLLAKW